MTEQSGYDKIVVDKRIYSIEAALSAGYILADRLYIFLDIEENDKLAIYFSPREEAQIQENESYKDIILDQLLYEAEKISVSKRNKKVREFIVGRALFSSVENMEEEEESYEDDPLGISTPWEEKYGEENEEGTQTKESEEGEGQEGYNIAVPWDDNSEKEQ